jgi:phage baseplate assembly protein gpV
MMHLLRNHMLMAADQATARLALVRMGTVTSYDPDHYAACVTLQPEGIETGWIPVTSPWVGNGWGFYAPPSIGSVVEVHFQQGGKEAAFVVNRFFSTKTVPLSVPSGEFWLVHQSGTTLKFTNDGNVLIEAANDLRIAAKNIKLHATETYAFDCNGQGQKWDGQGVETWQDNDVTKPHHDHAPPETPA